MEPTQSTSTSMSAKSLEATRRLFVGGLPPYAKYKVLLRAFAKDGAKQAHVIKRGEMRIAFITFDTAKEANAALERVKREGLFLYKRQLPVSKADPWHERGGSSTERKRQEDSNSGPSHGRPLPELPVKVIAYIGSFLPYKDRARMEQVSRLWREGSRRSHDGFTVLTTESDLWSYGWDRKPVSTEAYYWLLKRTGPTLKTIIINEARCEEELRSCVVTISAKACRNLEYVDLRSITVRPSGLRELADCTTQLREMILGKAWGPVDREIEMVFRRNPLLRKLELHNFRFVGASLLHLTDALQHLEIERCRKLETVHLEAFLRSTTRLETLRLISVKSLRGDGVLEVLANHQSFNTTLKELTIHDTNFTQPRFDDDDEEEPEEQNPNWEEDGNIIRPNFLELDFGPIGLGVIFPKNLRNITSLSLTAVGWIDAETIAKIARYMKDIEYLNISLSSNIRGNEALGPVAELLYLRTLKINNMHPTVDGEFLSRLGAIKHLEARDNDGFNTEHACGLLRNAAHLTSADFEGCTKIDHPIIPCAVEVTRAVERTTKLDLFLGGTSARKHEKNRLNLKLKIHFGRLSRKAV